MLYLQSLTCLVIRHHTCLEIHLCLTRFLHACTLLARCATLLARYVSCTLRYASCTLRYAFRPLRYASCTLHFLHATLRFLHATIRFLHATIRFSHATLLARFFGVVGRIGVCTSTGRSHVDNYSRCTEPRVAVFL